MSRIPFLVLAAVVFAQTILGQVTGTPVKNFGAVHAPKQIVVGGSALLLIGTEAPPVSASITAAGHIFRSYSIPKNWPLAVEPVNWCSVHASYRGGPMMYWFPEPSIPSLRVSLIAIRIGAAVSPRIRVEGDSGHKDQSLTSRLISRSFSTSQSRLSALYLTKIANQFDPHGVGSIVSRFVRVDRDMRQKTNSDLSDFRKNTSEIFLWSLPFVKPLESAVVRTFGEVRRHEYNGKMIDEDRHLGLDFAVPVLYASVKASNRGRVVFQGTLGLYGTCVVIDHGLGLQSVYGHLRDTEVKAGDYVERSQIIGHAGNTGLTEGNVLHFGIQIDGVSVDPNEWLDQRWLAINVGALALITRDR